MQILAMHAGPAQMVRHPFRLDTVREIFQRLQIFEVWGRGGGDRQRDAMHHHWIARADFFQRLQWLAARHHVVFADDLEPVDRRAAGKDLVVMLVAQAETEAEERRLCRRQRTRGARSFRQSARDVHPFRPTSMRYAKLSRNRGPAYRTPVPVAGFSPWKARTCPWRQRTPPWPLQAFWPLQALEAPLHALWPLQALAPTQWPSPAA